MKSFYTFLILSFITLGLYANSITGLTVIVDFEDCKLEYSNKEVFDLLNKKRGYKNNNNLASVREFYKIQSGNELDLKSQIIRIQLQANWNDYTNKEGYDGGQKLISDIVQIINSSYSKGLTGLTVDESNNLLYFQVLMSTPKRAGVAYTIHKPLYIINNGQKARVARVARSSFGVEPPNITTLCHEIGHHVLGWPDYYVVSDKTSNIGHYCMMGSGGDKMNPMQINPGLRLSRGWYKKIIELNSFDNLKLNLTAGDLSNIYLFRNKNNPKEYFVFEYLKHKSFYLSKTNDGYIPDQGLAIWHVLEGSNPNTPYVRLIQANGVDDMNNKKSNHRQKRGDDNDLYKQDNLIISYETNKNLRWKDGSFPNFKLTNLKIANYKANFVFDLYSRLD